MPMHCFGRDYFAAREACGLGALSGCVSRSALTVVRDGKLGVRLGEGGICGNGLLIAGDGVCDLAFEKKLVAGIEVEVGLLAVDGGAGEVSALTAIFGGLGAQIFGAGAELIGLGMIAGGFCGIGCG